MPKLVIEGTNQLLDIPSENIATALVAISQGKKLAVYVPPAKPVHPTMWGIAEPMYPNQLVTITGKCPQCGNGISMLQVEPFVHCGKNEYPPQDLALQLNQEVEKRNRAIKAAQNREPKKTPDNVRQALRS